MAFPPPSYDSLFPGSPPSYNSLYPNGSPPPPPYSPPAPTSGLASIVGDIGSADRYLKSPTKTADFIGDKIKGECNDIKTEFDNTADAPLGDGTVAQTNAELSADGLAPNGYISINGVTQAASGAGLFA
jgi:hypothetical protein